MHEQALYGPYGGVNESGFSSFRDSAANAVWFHGFNPEMFALAGKAGKAACVEYKTFRADFAEHPDLVPTGVDGKPIRYGRLVQGVCLSRRWFVDERMDELYSALKTFSPAGVWLDYLTYGGWFESPEPDLQDNCFCPDCIEDFRAAANLDVGTPAEIVGRYPDEWVARKTDRMADLAAQFSRIIKDSNPECLTGAYMCPWAPREYDGALSRIFGQDYTKLAGSIDVFTPLIYCDKSGRPPEWGRQWLTESAEFVPPGKSVQPILDYLDFPRSLEALAEGTVACRGVQIFAGREIFESSDRVKIFNDAVSALRNL